MDTVEEYEEVCNESWETTSRMLLQTAEQVCGQTTGRCGRERETCWWCEEVQHVIKQKRIAYKVWQQSGLQEASLQRTK